MVYRAPRAAPESQVPKEQRGRIVGKFCHACGSVYSLYSGSHSGKPIVGKDHVASPCVHEGEPFIESESWWERALEVLPGG
jgi:hypothetical protein